MTWTDLALVNAWQSRPHVREWWDEDDPYDAAWLDDSRIRPWIVSHDGHRFAYMQDYTVHGWEGHHFAHLPVGSRGIDQFIGDPDMIGKGHGTGFIAARLQTLFDEGIPVVATDPHPDNDRAIAVYEKVGFRAAGPATNTKWGFILPMTAQR